MRCMLIVFLIFFLGHDRVLGQKPPLDEKAIDGWPVFGRTYLSGDGNYMAFTMIAHAGVGGKRGNLLTVCSTTGPFRKAIPGVINAAFCIDNRHIVIRKGGDSLVVMDLDDGTEMFAIDSVRNFKLSKSRNGPEYAAIFRRNGKLRLLNLTDGREKSLENVLDFEFNGSGNAGYLKQTMGDNVALGIWHAGDSVIAAIWKGWEVTAIAFDGETDNLAFIGSARRAPVGSYSLWNNDGGTTEPHELVHDSVEQNGDTLKVKPDFISFVDGAGALCFQIRKVPSSDKNSIGYPNVAIWSHLDVYQKNDYNGNSLAAFKNTYWAVAYRNRTGMRLINVDGDECVGTYFDPNVHYAVAITVSAANANEAYRLGALLPNIYLVDLLTGQRSCIGRQVINAEPRFSPRGRYVIWHDPALKAYYTYNVASGVLNNITSGVPTGLDDKGRELLHAAPYGIGNWTEGDSSVLIYDEYDVWKVDPDGVKKPMDITGGYGKKKTMKFRVVNRYGRTWLEDSVLREKDSVILCAFDEVTKCNGFFKGDMIHGGVPLKLVMSPKFYLFSAELDGVTYRRTLDVSQDGKTFCLKVGSEKEFPNIFWTRDFRTFAPLTDFRPERAYNWYTTTLEHWKTFSGKTGTGILYKPENFDSTRKYPVIITFYETLSSGLHANHVPAWSVGPINIPWFVSRGYVVFCPDIHYTIGDPGAGIYDYVVSAAAMMKRFRWVDAKRLGIAGHSWGGSEVNFLVGSTGVFAAALSASGVADNVSDFAAQGLTPTAGPEPVKAGQNRMGRPIWEIPEAYIKNSPIFSADRVVTPLLLLSNLKDSNVPWEQGLEMFSVLRNLNKKVWMLQYRNGTHTLLDDNDAKDYTGRITEFFDYLLKGSSEPVWMRAPK